MSLQDALAQAWLDHADRPAEVSARFDAWTALAASPADLPAIAGLVVHVDGEHLGQWDRALDRLDALLRSPGLAPDDPAVGPLWRSVAAMALCAGRAPAHERALDQALATGGPRGSHVARVLAVAAAAAIGQGRLGDGARWFEEALDAATPLTNTDPAVRSISVTANNLAASLEESPERSAAQDALMLRAAAEARRAWERAGTWVHVERAEYRLSACHAAAGNWREAVAHAEACLAICAAHDDAGERCFAHEIHARALRGAGRIDEARAARDLAAACLADVTDPGMRETCASAVAALPT